MNPSPTFVALNRATFGATAEELARVEKMGWKAWVEEQLQPDDAAPDDAKKRIAAHRMRIEYEHEGTTAPAAMLPAAGAKGSAMSGGKPAMMMSGKPMMSGKAMVAGKPAAKRTWKVEEKRPLRLLDRPLEELFSVMNHEEYPYDEVQRANEEVEVATVLRACYSRWQVRELVVDFWHNHFNVDIDSENAIRAVWPAYDRDVIRKHALGNFRQLLEAVAQGLPMLYYLNNRTSKASPANENFARELFELHTLGAEHYFNHLYSKWREVPGATEGRPQGFIDQDVYEAARAFTGWTVADGEEVEDDVEFPATGGFHYHAAWHDPYQKRVLGVEIEANQSPLADGLQVLDMLASHPGTAKHLSRKLCRRFIADEPPEALVERVAKVWMANAKSPEQIRHVLRAILTAPEMQTGFGQKTKRPLEFAAGFLRVTGAEVRPDRDLLWELEECGQRLFQCGPPTGYPDTAAHWQSPNSLLKRWQMARDMATDDDEDAAVRMDLAAQTPKAKRTWQSVADYWMDRVAPGGLLGAETRAELAKWFRQYEEDDKPQWHKPDEAIALEPDDLVEHLGEFVALIAATPEFQLR